MHCLRNGTLATVLHPSCTGSAAGARHPEGMRSLVTISLLLAAVALVGCGQSAQDKAKQQVCDARTEIGKQVDYLQGLTLTTASVSGIENSVKSIGNSLKKIADAAPQLTSERKQQAQAANAAFKSALQSIAANLGQNLSLSTAATQLKSAFAALADAYQKTLKPINCS
jgi:hypothetical protein